MYSPKVYLKDWWIVVPLFFVISSQLFMWWYSVLHIHSSADQIFLHYSSIFGVDLVGAWWKIFYLPLLGLIIFFLNYGLSFFLYSSEKFLARILVVGAGVSHLFLVVALWFVVGLNI